jgi:excisionase family DNA binding protein
MQVTLGAIRKKQAIINALQALIGAKVRLESAQAQIAAIDQALAARHSQIEALNIVLGMQAMVPDGMAAQTNIQSRPPEVEKVALCLHRASLAAELRSQDSLMEVPKLEHLLGVDKFTIYDWVKAGKIPAQHVGSRIKFDPRKLATWLDRNSTGD